MQLRSHSLLMFRGAHRKREKLFYSFAAAAARCQGALAQSSSSAAELLRFRNGGCKKIMARKFTFVVGRCIRTIHCVHHFSSYVNFSQLSPKQQNFPPNNFSFSSCFFQLFLLFSLFYFLFFLRKERTDTLTPRNFY